MPVWSRLRRMIRRQRFFLGHHFRGTMESLAHEQEAGMAHWRAPMLASIRSTYAATHGLTLLRDVLAERAGAALLELLGTLVGAEPDPLALATVYSNTFRE